MNNIKKCGHCKTEKNVIEFTRDKSQKDGLRATCKTCIKLEYDKNKEKHIATAKKYRLKNKEKLKERRNTPECREKNRIYIKNRRKNPIFRLEENERKRQYHQSEKGIQARRKYYNEVLKQNLEYQIQNCLRARVHLEIKKLKKKLNIDVAKYTKTINLLGCSISELKIHLEKQFKPGMNWENHGYGDDKWHIDHIIPCASFDLTKEEDQRKCFHYTNLQPLWQNENFKKSNKVLL